MIPKTITEAQRTEVIEKSSNACCICQTPFIQIHHIDGNNENNVFDNFAPLCPNHHVQAQHTLDAKSNMINNLTIDRIKEIRDSWYKYCEKRRDFSNVSGNAKLKLKNFILPITFAKFSWKDVFRSLDEKYDELTRDEILDRVFSTTNPDELKTRLESVEMMYADYLKNPENKKKFEDICYSFGIKFY